MFLPGIVTYLLMTYHHSFGSQYTEICFKYQEVIKMGYIEQRGVLKHSLQGCYVGCFINSLHQLIDRCFVLPCARTDEYSEYLPQIW